LKTVEGLGMPFHKQNYKFGNLFIQFKIQFPTKLSNVAIGKIRESLGDSKASMEIDDNIKEKYVVSDFKEFHRNTHHEGGA
jgi:DnaJ-class molecular chaperone